MVWGNYKFLSFMVACLHIVYSAKEGIFLSLYIIEWNNIVGQGDDVKPNIYRIIELSVIVLFFILSILLLIGIIQNRPEFMAAWIFAHYLLFCAIIGVILYQVKEGIRLRYLLATIYVVAIYLGCLAITILLYFPVYKFYKQLLTTLPSPGNCCDFLWIFK